MTNNTLNRFSNRVENYVKFRPTYPSELVDYLVNEGVLKKGQTIADIGSGTGISADLFLKNGFEVIGVEPNNEMRFAAEKMLGNQTGFKSIDATAENTTIPDSSVDAITVAQAFHWFDKEKCKIEFNRILKNDRYVILIWNDRRTDTTDFLKVYEDFLKMFGTDYEKVNHKNTQDIKVFDDFFGIDNWKEKQFYNYQDVDLEALKGRVLSSSYMPDEGHKDYEFMMACLKKIFNRYQQNETVKLEYDTKIYYGKLN